MKSPSEASRPVSIPLGSYLRGCGRYLFAKPQDGFSIKKVENDLWWKISDTCFSKEFPLIQVYNFLNWKDVNIGVLPGFGPAAELLFAGWVPKGTTFVREK